MPQRQKAKIIKETKIPVRVVKINRPLSKIESVKQPAVPKKSFQKLSRHPLDEKSKGFFIGLAVLVIMFIIVVLWFSFLKYNLKQPGQEGQSLWGEIKNNLTNNLSGTGKVWERITNLFSSNTNVSSNQELENRVFPEIKSTNTNQ